MESFVLLHYIYLTALNTSYLQTEINNKKIIVGCIMVIVMAINVSIIINKATWQHLK